MSLLNQASLIQIPSGYKEGTLYSAKPINGDGDLSFTRASIGTRINSEGLVEVCPYNICTYSEELNIWSTERASVTANATTAPNGTATADKVITDSTANNTHQIYIGPFTTPNLPFVISAYAKKSEYDYIHLGASGSSTKTWFDLNNGTVGTQSSDVLSASIESVGNGWYRCINIINNTSTSNYVELGPASVDGSRVISGTPSGGIFVWGAQLNIGSTAKPYFPTTDRLNVPRLTYPVGGGCPSLLLEKQSTNLALYSEQMDNAVWVKSNVTVTANNTTSPAGFTDADLITLNAGTSLKQFYQSFSAVTGTYAFSVFAKKGTHNFIQLLAGPSAICNFDLELGTFNATASTGSIQNYGNGWFKCNMVATYTSNTAVNVLGVNSLTSVRAEATSSTGTFYAWGLQYEASSYPTSYIPTTSSSATRVADACSKTGII
jgi:hypothetical protein